MSEEHEEEVRAPMREAAGEGGDLRERVRRLVLDAVLMRQADPKAMREVMHDTVAGLGEGLGAHAGNAGESLRTAVAGLDEAMGKSIFALQMALEETWDKGRRFADSDLRQAYDAIKDVEDDLVGTLKRVGAESTGLLKEEFTRMGEHLGRNGSDTGSQARQVLEVLGREMSTIASGAAKDAAADAREAAGRLSAVTSGILRGLADALDGRKPG